MYIQHLTKDELLRFLKDEYKYAQITIINFFREEKEDTATFDIKLVNLRGDIFKFKVIFSDFKCEMVDKVGGKVIKSFTDKWTDWVASIFKVRENIGNTRILSNKYKESCDSFKQANKKKKTKQTKIKTEDNTLKVG